MLFSWERESGWRIHCRQLSLSLEPIKRWVHWNHRSNHIACGVMLYLPTVGLALSVDCPVPEAGLGGSAQLEDLTLITKTGGESLYTVPELVTPV